MQTENMAIYPSMAGKVAVITGAGSGIGKATAILFAANKASLFLIGRDEAKLKETQETCLAYGVRCLYSSTDLTDANGVENAFAKCLTTFGYVDILCNVAGGSTGRRNTFDITGDEFDEVYKLNLKNVFLCCKEVLPVMKERCYGRIVNVSSLIGRVAGDNTNIAYASLKAGIDQFSKYLAREVGEYGIYVNSVSPGYIESSQRISDLWANTTNMDEVFKRLSIKRPGRAMEVANAIAFLASDESSYITGEVIDINGGAIMG